MHESAICDCVVLFVSALINARLTIVVLNTSCLLAS